jgi:hypothetical protein
VLPVASLIPRRALFLSSYSLAIWTTLPCMAIAALLITLLSRHLDFEPVPAE